MTEPTPTPEPQEPPFTVIALALASFAFALYYNVIRRNGLMHTSALFIGLPALLAILLALTPRAKSATGAITKGITLALLIIAPPLGEGMICILMAAPIFLLVGIIIGALVDWQRKRRGVTLSCCALVLIPMSLEGVVPQLTFNRRHSVSVTRVVNALPAEVEAALSQSPRVDAPLPAYFSLGFPLPTEAHGAGLSVGSLRTIHFTGAEGAPPGDLVVRVAAAGPGYLRTETVSDHTKIAQWMLWQSSEVTWRAVDASHTSVTWQIVFQRQLDPAWYFIPWEKYAVHEAAAYMIEANAVPTR